MTHAGFAALKASRRLEPNLTSKELSLQCHALGTIRALPWTAL